MTETTGFIFNHTMLRVKDINASLHFYCDILGMRLVRRSDYEGFSLYFLLYVANDVVLPEDDETLKQWVANQPSVLELTHNHGTEQQTGAIYHNGNSDPRGFGHICISVPDFDAAIAYFDRHQITFQKRPEDGQMRDIAFIKDPDEYWIEIIGQNR